MRQLMVSVKQRAHKHVDPVYTLKMCLHCFKMHLGQSGPKWKSDTHHCIHLCLSSSPKFPADQLCSDFITAYVNSATRLKGLVPSY